MLLENPHLLALLHEDADALSPSDRDTLIVLGIRNLSNFETAFEEASRGLQDEAGLARRIKAVWNRPQLNYGMPLAWPTFRERTSPDFVAWMERNVVNVEN